MEKVLRCDCGYEVRAQSDDELAVGVRRHAREAHRIEFTHDEALILVFRRELDDGTSRSSLGDRTSGGASVDDSRKE